MIEWNTMSTYIETIEEYIRQDVKKNIGVYDTSSTTIKEVN